MSHLDSQILVLAGDEDQYRNWLEHHGYSPEQARFVGSEADYAQARNFRYVNPGTFWQNPAFGPALLAHFRKHGRLLCEPEQ